MEPLAFGLQKYSPYLGLFDFYIKQLKEKGTMQQIIQRYDAKEQECPDNNGHPIGTKIILK
jgi:ABC-type amino acid transport substrate-binding protein